MYDWNWDVKNQEFLNNTIDRCKRENILLPTFEQLKNPHKLNNNLIEALKKVGPQEMRRGI